MRVGQSGIGFSNNGVNGPYESAWTIDGKFVADFITAGTLNAALLNIINLSADSITAGTLSSADGESVLIDLEKGEGTFTGYFQTVQKLYGGLLQKAILDYGGLSVIRENTDTGAKATAVDLGFEGLLINGGLGTASIDAPYMRSDEEGDRGGRFNLTETDVGSVSMGVRGNVYPAEDDTTPKAYLDLQNEVDGTKFSVLLQNGNATLAGRNYTGGQGFYLGIDYDRIVLGGLTEPIDDSDAVNKAYVDGKFLEKNGVIPISGGGTGGKTVAEAQATLHVTQDYLFSQMDSAGNKSLDGIDAYPTSPGVFRVTTNSTAVGVPGNYGCLVIFNGGSYYMHLYVNASGFWTARTTSMTVPTAWNKMATTADLDGLEGSSAVSPTVTISTIAGGHRVTITDAGGTKSFDVMDGEDGSSGADGISVTHEWSGTTLKVTSASGTTSADLKGNKGDRGAAGVGIKSITITEV
jgi:hypothetical protein